MFQKVSLEDWENLVKKQLKTEDIYSILLKENLEGISVRPYEDFVVKPFPNLPKIEESTQLVASYNENLEQDIFAFLLYENQEQLSGKSIFIPQEFLAKTIDLKPENRYFSLVDVFDETYGKINEPLTKELLSKNFERSIAIDISLHQNSGASIVQQIGIALAKTKELIEVFGAEIMSKLIIRVAIGANYFFEMAKIRALKLVFLELSREYHQEVIPYIFAETSLRNKSRLDAENNLIRSTLELSSAMIGGADSIFAHNYQLEKSTELSQEISFKQQIVLAYESIINVFDDAANGSYYIEDITRQIAEKSWQYFLQIEERDGFLENLKSGEIQKEIYNQAVAEQNWVETGKIKLIGVNLYPTLEKKKSTEELYTISQIKPVRWSEMYE